MASGQGFVGFLLAKEPTRAACGGKVIRYTILDSFQTFHTSGGEKNPPLGSRQNEYPRRTKASQNPSARQEGSKTARGRNLSDLAQ